MAIVKASYTRHAPVAKAATRYIESRPGKDGQRLVRTLFTKDGKLERREAYELIDQADKGSYFYRLVISPDPRREDQQRNLSLREITEETMQSLETRLKQSLRWIAAIHADHADHRHVHAIAIVPERLTVQDFQRMRGAAAEAALVQLQQLELAHEAHQQHQEQGMGLELWL